MTRTSLLGALAVVVCVGCGAAGASSPRPAGAAPSKAAKMVCGDEGQKEIADALGVHTSVPVAATWADHLYSCPYQYADGRMDLSVKELTDAASTDAYFTSVEHTLGAGAVVAGVGQGAYQGADGSIVVRKDFKVLRVDVGGLPAQVGSPTIDRSEAAVRVAIVVMGCWTDS